MNSLFSNTEGRKTYSVYLDSTAGNRVNKSVRYFKLGGGEKREKTTSCDDP